MADVARACGDCHLANETTLGEPFQVAAPLLDDPATRHTNYLSWVSRLLWDGLLGPSEPMWQTRCRRAGRRGGLTDPRAETCPPGKSPAPPGLKDLGWRRGGRRRADPGRLLAEVWTTCADCHTQAGVR